MATRPVSSFTIIFILFLVIFEVTEIEAQDSECLKEYGGDVGVDVSVAYCAPKTYPKICYVRCQADKGAKGGRCITGDDGVFDYKCLCDYCSDKF
ncbi:unnamed protein product [Brassica oleracea var. botrytis]